MEYTKLVEARASCRSFRDDPVSPDDLREMVRLASRAPSPANAQPWRFIGILDRELLHVLGASVRRKLEDMLPEGEDEGRRAARERVIAFSTFFAKAPAVIAVTLSSYRAVIDEVLEDPRIPLDHDKVNEMRMRPDLQCIGAAVEHLLLAATDMGYGGCWLSGPLLVRAEVERQLDIRSPEQLAAMVAIGRPAHEPLEPRPRKPLDEIFTLRLGNAD